MELKQKGETTAIDVSRPLTVTMKWTTAADFDLAAAYETQEGQQGLIYFGDRGQRNQFPYITLSEDKGVGDKGGNNQEIMHIQQLTDMNYIWIFCWDYGMVQQGRAARFRYSDVDLTISDELGHTIAVKVDTGDRGNVCCIATLDNSNPSQTKLINYSQIGTLNKLQTLEQLINIVQQFVI